jgi:hypothetical protein
VDAKVAIFLTYAKKSIEFLFPEKHNSQRQNKLVEQINIGFTFIHKNSSSGDSHEVTRENFPKLIILQLDLIRSDFV